jgi:hypothetical protein
MSLKFFVVKYGKLTRRSSALTHPMTIVDLYQHSSAGKNCYKVLHIEILGEKVSAVHRQWS